jgi:hypothetical protein
MEQDDLRLDSNGVPVWIAQICDEERIDRLSDTRTHRLLLVIFRALVHVGSALAESDDDGRANEMETFTTWFVKFGKSLPAYNGLMWAYSEVGHKALATRNSDEVGDVRLKHITMAFRLLLDDWEPDAAVDLYCEMICKGWAQSTSEQEKQSLHQGLVATLTKHAQYELNAIGEARGVTERETRASVYRMVKSTGVEPLRNFRS